DHLVDRAVLVDRERRRLGLREVLGLGDGELDLPRLEGGVDVALLAPDDLAGRAQHMLRPQLLRERVRLRRGLGMEDELDDPGAVAQVDEDQPAVVAAAVDPAGDADLLPHARGVELAGPGVAVQVRAWRSHSCPLMWCMTVSGATSLSSPPSRSRS